MAVHETGDFRAPFRLEQDYRWRVDKAGTAHLLVQRAVRWPGHCGMDNGVREPDLTISSSGSRREPCRRAMYSGMSEILAYGGRPYGIQKIQPNSNNA
jgi:hypothetical protein